jgi:hypothetical protein
MRANPDNTNKKYDAVRARAPSFNKINIKDNLRNFATFRE